MKKLSSKSDRLVAQVMRLTKSCPAKVLTKCFLQKHLYSLAYHGAIYMDSVIQDGVKYHRFAVRKRDVAGNFRSHVVSVEY